MGINGVWRQGLAIVIEARAKKGWDWFRLQGIRDNDQGEKSSRDGTHGRPLKQTGPEKARRSVSPENQNQHRVLLTPDRHGPPRQKRTEKGERSKAGLFDC